jgi:hypothetical protein
MTEDVGGAPRIRLPRPQASTSAQLTGRWARNGGLMPATGERGCRSEAENFYSVARVHAAGDGVIFEGCAWQLSSL